MADKIDWKKFERDVRSTMENGFMGVRELSRETGIGKATISRARHGKTLSAISFMQVCRKLDLDPWSYLVGETK
jgi:Cro/C1-type HTH DNA-binding domain